MKNPILKFVALAALTSFIGFQSAKASLNAPVYSTAHPTTADNSDISAADLINQGAPSYVSQVDSDPAFATPITDPIGTAYLVNATATNDGQADPGAGLSHDTYVPNGTGIFVYTLNLAANSNGYTITTVNLFSGYQGGFYNQDFKLYYTTTTDSTYQEIGGEFINNDFTQDPALPTGFPIQDSVDETSLSDSTGIIATNVATVKLEYNSPVIKELDVNGYATPSISVPEPSACALLLAGLAFLAARFRRSLV